MENHKLSIIFFIPIKQFLFVIDDKTKRSDLPYNVTAHITLSCFQITNTKTNNTSLNASVWNNTDIKLGGSFIIIIASFKNLKALHFFFSFPDDYVTVKYKTIGKGE